MLRVWELGIGSLEVSTEGREGCGMDGETDMDADAISAIYDA